MDRYYVNRTAQSNGDHEVHKLGCYWLSRANSTQDLGMHHGCASAVEVAKQYYSRSNGCAYCSPACHTS